MISTLIHKLWGELNRSVQDFCDLETVDNQTLVANDGSLATIVQLHGFKTILSSETLAGICKQLAQDLMPFFNAKGHQLQIIFTKDDEVNQELEDLRTIKHQQSAVIGLNIGGLIDENIDKYASYIYNEKCYWVFWSRPELLNPLERKESIKQEIKLRQEIKLPPSIDAQNITINTSLLMQQHLSFVTTISNKLNILNYSLDILDADNMLLAVKNHILPLRTSRNWKASYPSKALPLRWKTNDSYDISELLYPTLPSQIMTASAIEGDKDLLDDTVVKFGERIYAPVLFDMPPMNLQSFNELFSGLGRIKCRNKDGATNDLPFTLSMMIEGGGLMGSSLNVILASMLGMASSINNNINSAKEALTELKNNNNVIVKFKISACTWATVGTSEVNDLLMRKANLIKALESWGNGKVIDKSGSPMEALQSTSLALSYKHIANGGAAPLDDVVKLMPITRPASLFKQGTIVYRSKDGKLMLYQRFSSEQTTWITLITGRPGFGKSVLMNDGNIELCISSGMKELPYICNIDIGVTSQGMVELIRDSLPQDKKHLVLYERLQNKPEYCVNPFDTGLGCRIPFAKEKSYLINFLTMLATPPERKGKAYEGMSDFCSRIIDGVYKIKAGIDDRSTPNKYSPNHDIKLDEILQKTQVYVNGMSYWDITDALFNSGELYGAEISQRYAVPTLDDCISMAASTEITNEFRTATTESGTPIFEAFQMGVRGGISQFPIFSGYTKFDIGSARIMSLDLNDVTSSGKTDVEFKQNALMYMMARQCFMKKVAYSEEEVKLVQPMYKSYYTNLVAKLTDSFKTLCYDEYHRTGNVPSIENQTMTDARESRKWQMELVIASQFLEDMGDIANIATNIFICDAGTTASRNYIRSKLGLTSEQEASLINNCTGPNEHGMSFLAIQDSKSNSKIYQNYTVSIGPKRLWGLSTTAEDRRLRSELMKDVSLSRDDVLNMLAKRFPSGSCKKTVEAKKQQIMNDSSNSDMITSAEDKEKLDNSIIENIAQQMLSSIR
jgi:intracellular multiplication protein IcmB